MPKSQTKKIKSSSAAVQAEKPKTKKPRKTAAVKKVRLPREIPAQVVPAAEPDVSSASPDVLASPPATPEVAPPASPLVDVHVDLKKLSDLALRFSSLTFLQPRLEKMEHSTIGYADLVGLYRIASGIIADECEENLKKTKKLDEELKHVRRYQDSAKRETEAPLIRKIREKESDLAEKNDQLQKAEAARAKLEEEFVVYRNRLQEEKKKHLETANEQLLLKVLPVVDNFERALAACRSTDNLERVIEGVEMIFKQFEEMLSSEEVKVISTRGEAFDPIRHEAFDREETFEFPEDTVIGEYRKGYFIKEKVLRPALVKISKVPPGDSVEYDVRAGEMIEEIQRGIECIAELEESEPDENASPRGLAVVE